MTGVNSEGRTGTAVADSSAIAGTGSLCGDRPTGIGPDRLLLPFLLLLAVMVFTRDISDGGLRYSDACTHAMDGVLIHDWGAAGPTAWRDPVGFAMRQYSHYPTLGIGRVYPPGFACVEAVFFAIFGVSALTARLCVVCFGLAAVAGCYLLGRRMMGSAGAAIAVGALLSMPGVVYWTRQTMLEMPTLAMLTWASLAFLHYLDKPTRSRLLMFLALAVASPLFKQTAIFIIPVLGLLMLWQAYRRTIPISHAAWAAMFALPAAVAFLGHALYAEGSVSHVGTIVLRGRSPTELIDWSQLMFYPGTWPTEIGLCVLLAAVAGLILTMRRLDLPRVLIILWFATFLTMMILVRHKEARYFFFGFLPIALWAGVAGAELVDLLKRPAARAVSIALLVCLLTTMGYRSGTPIQPDYTSVVAQHEAMIREAPVLFEGHRDGDFVFAARKLMGPDGCTVLRASKLFYACASDPRFRFTSLIESPTQIGETIASLGLTTVFVERDNVLMLRETEMLMDELSNSSRYVLAQSHEFSVRHRSGRNRTKIVDVYRVKDPPRRRVRFVDLPIPIANRTIRIDLDELSRPET